MRKGNLCAIWVLVISLIFTPPTLCFAEESNRAAVRSALAKDWDGVVWGATIAQADYPLFLKAVDEALTRANPEPIYKLFGPGLADQIDQIAHKAPEIGHKNLVRLLVQAFSKNGAMIRHGRLEISAGLAIYQRWENAKACQPPAPFLPKNQNMNNCSLAQRLHQRIRLPDQLQLYFRFRWIAK